MTIFGKKDNGCNVIEQTCMADVYVVLWCFMFIFYVLIFDWERKIELLMSNDVFYFVEYISAKFCVLVQLAVVDADLTQRSNFGGTA